ncbi:putative NAD-dependent epimerase/dehydratase family protein [Virgibacillus natechei]|uniref:NAD-dependent epimerase/dehydratase family protein n=1 Tax=Virgibacillus natechei TaxID=1216297 RepID=A0ABS4IH91_9BACI|nr:DUF1611 domain-containing protein [Virgibacillus natechei]MBP1970290.1 putative NAD-dependent epimerase/dehydratase family protein [Virgibacillus natechei]UZD13118.1 DUF1611 domain-containing protein [Virgibacillus natechei]
MKETAIIYCENNFGKMDGKTANGLVRSSRKYQIQGVIDSTKVGMDTGELLSGEKNGIPVFASLDHALKNLPTTPAQFIYGIAPSEAFLKSDERNIVLRAMENGMNIVNTLHEFFTDDEEFVKHSKQFNVTITDVRKPPHKKDMHLFTGRILHIETPVITILGTDSAIGKRTTSVLLEEALNKKGIKTAFITTGQTGLIQGAKYGIAVDALPSQFITGEIENEIMKAHDTENPDIIIVEGQGALSHPAYISSNAIIRGSRPGAVIVQHAPKRKFLGDFNFMEMPTLKGEIELIEAYSKISKVIATTINHEDMTDKEVEEEIKQNETQLNLPSTDVLTHGCDKLIDSIFKSYPELKGKQKKVLVN